MNIGYLTLQRLCNELREHWTGLRVRAGVAEGTDLFLEADNGRILLLSASSRAARIAEFPRPLPDSLQSPPWAARHVDGAAIREIRLVPYERIIEIDLARRDRVGGQYHATLIGEFIGRRSNVFLVSGNDRRIVASLRQNPGGRGPGRPYESPSQTNRHVPPDLTVELLGEILREKDGPATNLTRRISGLDPVLSEELLAAAGISGPDPSPETLARLLENLRRTLEHPPWAPEPAIVAVGNRHEVCVIQLRHLATSESPTFGSVSQAIEELARSERTHVVRQGESRSIRKTLEKLLCTADRKIARIRDDLQDAASADDLERFGNILMASLSQVPPRADSVSLPDLYTPGADVTIPLDPEKTAIDNAGDYLRRCKKVRKAGPIAAKRLAETERERKDLKAAIASLDAASEERLQELREGWVERGWLRPARSTQPQQRRRPGEINPRRYITSDGWTVLVGRSNKENDLLTRKSAGDDLFFHAQGCPGSHVILKREGKAGDPGRAALQEAAGLAAYWSKARGAKTVPVNYTQIRHVTKPRGAAAGLVTIRNEKTLFVSPVEIPRADET